ncbi:hypothetical protein [Chitinophaga sp. HK235]|uniref:hypothetical protein n=1 Tax=Chitinophaga sp. HK235 TaxID=2952571 RepID=UPI001BA691B2|nr:hypothetical protein [Chitinophaga sp. HK235]
MKKILLLHVLIALFLSVKAQRVHKISADSVLLTGDCCGTELILENKTSKINGFLKNNGKGRTSFAKLQLVTVGDSAIAIPGQDTLQIRDVWWLGNMTRGLVIAPDTNYLVPASIRVVLLPDISQPRQITLPAPEQNKNREIVIVDKTSGSNRWKISGAFVNRGVNGTPPYTAENNLTVGQGDKLMLVSDGVKWYNTQVCCGM